MGLRPDRVGGGDLHSRFGQPFEIGDRELPGIDELRPAAGATPIAEEVEKGGEVAGVVADDGFGPRLPITRAGFA